MDAGGRMRETVDPEFATYVDARQDRWLRAAYLVYGDLERAEEQLLHAFTRLSLRWGRVDDPDVYAQRLLYRAALSRWFRPKPAEANRTPPTMPPSTSGEISLPAVVARWHWGRAYTADCGRVTRPDCRSRGDVTWMSLKDGLCHIPETSGPIG
jgi:hypothetical protein